MHQIFFIEHGVIGVSTLWPANKCELAPSMFG